MSSAQSSSRASSASRNPSSRPLTVRLARTNEDLTRHGDASPAMAAAHRAAGNGGLVRERETRGRTTQHSWVAITRPAADPSALAECPPTMTLCIRKRDPWTLGLMLLGSLRPRRLTLLPYAPLIRASL